MTLPPEIARRGVHSKSTAFRKKSGKALTSIQDVYMQSQYTKRWFKSLADDHATSPAVSSSRGVEVEREWQVLKAETLRTARQNNDRGDTGIKEKIQSVDKLIAALSELHVAKVQEIDLDDNIPGPLKIWLKTHVNMKISTSKVHLVDKFKVDCQTAKALKPSAPEPRRVRPNLPQVAKNIMRTWLHENFHHPYPSEDEKTDLAMRAGISVEQVNNWFINARGREWRPKVKLMADEQVAGRSTALTDVMHRVSVRVGNSRDTNLVGDQQRKASEVPTLLA